MSSEARISVRAAASGSEARAPSAWWPPGRPSAPPPPGRTLAAELARATSTVLHAMRFAKVVTTEAVLKAAGRRIGGS
ncbi:hypothetical protein ACWCXH_22650 [Kitasatospora sp. NPDC001660]